MFRSKFTVGLSLFLDNMDLTSVHLYTKKWLHSGLSAKIITRESHSVYVRVRFQHSACLIFLTHSSNSLLFSSWNLWVWVLNYLYHWFLFFLYYFFPSNLCGSEYCFIISINNIDIRRLSHRPVQRQWVPWPRRPQAHSRPSPSSTKGALGFVLLQRRSQWEGSRKRAGGVIAQASTTQSLVCIHSMWLCMYYNFRVLLLILTARPILQRVNITSRVHARVRHTHCINLCFGSIISKYLQLISAFNHCNCESETWWTFFFHLIGTLATVDWNPFPVDVCRTP